MGRLILYCPDKNFLLYHDMPFKEGIGGGKTAILLLLKYISQYFDRVEFIGNVAEGEFGNIKYVNFKNCNSLKGDYLLVTTSSDLDITPLMDLKIETKKIFLWLHNYINIKGMEKINWDWIIANSNFVKERFEERTGYKNCIAIPNGTPWCKRAEYMAKIFLKREKFGIVFASSPLKGLDNTIEIVKYLREETRLPFFLDIFGGYRLWGIERDMEKFKEKFIRFKGLLPLCKLTYNLYKYNFMIQVFEYEEPFGMVYSQAMRAGVIPFLSDTGAVKEIVKDGQNGFLIPAKKLTKEVLKDVKEKILYLLNNPHILNQMRSQTYKSYREWREVAKEMADLIYGNKRF